MSESVEVRFKRQLVDANVVLLEEEWLGNRVPHRIRCAQGHVNAATPRKVVANDSHPCRQCGGRPSPAQAYANFIARLTDFGATLLEDHWLGAKNLHRIRCVSGHEQQIRPKDLPQGRQPCRTCSYQNRRVDDDTQRRYAKLFLET